MYFPAKMLSEDLVINTLKTHLPGIQKIDDLTVNQYLKKVANREKEFQV